MFWSKKKLQQKFVQLRIDIFPPAKQNHIVLCCNQLLKQKHKTQSEIHKPLLHEIYLFPLSSQLCILSGMPTTDWPGTATDWCYLLNYDQINWRWLPEVVCGDVHDSILLCSVSLTSPWQKCRQDINQPGLDTFNLLLLFKWKHVLSVYCIEEWLPTA